MYTAPVAQPAPTHNKTRGILLAAGCVACASFMLGALFSPLWTLSIIGPAATIDYKFGLFKMCISGAPEGSGLDNGCSDVHYDCDALRSHIHTITAFYAITCAILGIALFAAVGDLMGAITQRLLHVPVLCASALCALIGFILVFVTYNGTYCGGSFADPPTPPTDLVTVLSSIGASPFLCMIAGIGSCVGVLFAALMKDKAVSGEQQPLQQPQQQADLYGQQPQPQMYQQGQQQVYQPQQQQQQVAYTPQQAI